MSFLSQIFGVKTPAPNADDFAALVSLAEARYKQIAGLRAKADELERKLADAESKLMGYEYLRDEYNVILKASQDLLNSVDTFTKSREFKVATEQLKTAIGRDDIPEVDFDDQYCDDCD